MPKIQFSDVVPPDRRSIRNIPISTTSRKHSPLREPVQPIRQEPSFSSAFPKPPSIGTIEKDSGTPEEYYFHQKPPALGPNRRKWFFGILILAAIIVFAVVMMTALASATVVISPKSESLTLSMKLEGAVEAGAGQVYYEILKLSQSKEVEVKATGEEMQERKASGTIVIYNNFSKDPQRLISRTRFETETGLIYRIPESIVIPGRSTKDGKEIPGSIAVKVFADEAGEKYNIGKTDFKIPGFKNDQKRYTTIYARGSTEMTGGFIGKVKTVVQSEKDAALASLESQIKSSLEKDLLSKIPDGLISLKNSITYEFKELPQKDAGSSVSITYEGTAHALLLRSSNLSDIIFGTYLANKEDWLNIPGEVTDWSGLEVVGVPEIETQGKAVIEVRGTASANAKVDATSVQEKLAGQNRKEVENVMEGFPGIAKVRATLRPMWKTSFPTNPAKIYVELEAPPKIDTNT